MIVENIPKQRKEAKKVKCLYREFGAGIHLLKKILKDEYALLVIGNGETDAFFIFQSNELSHLYSVDGELTFSDFYKFYDYIKKLEPSELIVRLSQ